MKTCQIQWIDDNGKPTPDSNPAIGRVRCKQYSYDKSGQRNFYWEGLYSSWYNICAEHAKRLDAPNMREWEFEPFAKVV